MREKEKRAEVLIVKRRSFVWWVRDLFVGALLWVGWFWMLFSFGGESSFWEERWDLFTFYGYWYLGIVVGAGLFLVGWSSYNKRRYGRMQTRVKIPNAITKKRMADALRVDMNALALCKEARYLQIVHLKAKERMEESHFERVEVGVKSLYFYFSDDWNRIRSLSNFGYTHLLAQQRSFNGSYTRIVAKTKEDKRDGLKRVASDFG